MKRFNSFLVFVFAAALIFLTLSPAFATAPERLNYQGTLTDNNGTPITGTVSMVFNIYDQLTGGNLIWGPETIASAQVKNGLFAVVLGETVPVSASMFSSGSRYISVTVNDEPMSPRQLINSVPYALNGIPSGVIAMWSGAVNNIPTGWALCDGTNGTPNLRDRFIVGAGGGYGVNATGGEATHILTTNEMPVHTHTQTSHNHGTTGGFSNNHIHSGTTGYESATHTHYDSGHAHDLKLGSSDETVGASNSADAAAGGSTKPYVNTGYASLGTESANHTHSFTTDGGNADHSHAVYDATATNQNNGGGAAHNNLPPYYALAFIMKM